MPTATTRTFRSGNSEAVRLPKEMAFGPDVELTLVRSGDVLTITPKRMSPRELVHRLRAMPAPSAIGTRDEVEIPERDGL
jgi:antitoxin VapB